MSDSEAPTKRRKLDTSATWQRVVSPSQSTPPRTIDVNATTSLSYDRWRNLAGNQLVFNISLRTSSATDEEVALYPAHAAAADLLAHSEFFERYVRHTSSSSFFAADPARQTIGLDIEQRYLHAAVRCLYEGRIELSPENVESILMVAQYLTLQPVMEACKEYLLVDILLAGDTKLGCEVCDLAHNYASWMLPDLLELLGGVGTDDECKSLGVLDSGLSLEEAVSVLQRMKPRMIGSLLLQIIARLPNKRLDLLPLVDFHAMHFLELQAVQRLALARLEADSDTDTTFNQRFWQVVVNRCAKALLDGPKPIEGLFMCSVDVQNIEQARAEDFNICLGEFKVRNTKYRLVMEPAPVEGDEPQDRIAIGLYVQPDDPTVRLRSDSRALLFCFLVLCQKPCADDHSCTILHYTDIFEPKAVIPPGYAVGSRSLMSDWAKVEQHLHSGAHMSIGVYACEHAVVDDKYVPLVGHEDVE